MLTPAERKAKYGDSHSPNHPGALLERFGFFTEDDAKDAPPALRDVQQAHSLTVRTWSAIYGLIETAQRDPSQNEAAKLKSIASEARKAADKAKRNALAAIEHAHGAVKAIEQDLRAASRPPTPTDAGIDSEVRAYLRGLKPAEAFAQVMRAADSYTDESTALLRAAASGPAFLSGLNDDMQRQCRERFHARIRPEHVESLGRYRKGIATATKAVNALDTHVADFVDFETADKLNALSIKPLDVAS
jgi:hypothetical protein